MRDITLQALEFGPSSLRFRGTHSGGRGKGNAVSNAPVLVNNVPQTDGMRRLDPMRLPSTRLDGLGLVVPSLEGEGDGLAPLVVVGGPPAQEVVEVAVPKRAGAEAVGIVPAVAAPDADAMVGRVLADGRGAVSYTHLRAHET